MTPADIEAQVGAAQGLWTHTPVDWGENLGFPKPAGWPVNAAQGYLGQGTGTRPGGAVTQSGPPGTVTISAISVTAITATGATVNFTLSAAPSSSNVLYGVSTTLGSTKAGSTATTQAVALTGLVTKTTYYYQVQAINGSGTALSTMLTFTTT